MYFWKKDAEKMPNWSSGIFNTWLFISLLNLNKMKQNQLALVLIPAFTLFAEMAQLYGFQILHPGFQPSFKA